MKFNDIFDEEAFKAIAVVIILIILVINLPEIFDIIIGFKEALPKKDNKMKITIEIENADINLIEDAIYQFQE